MFTVPPAAFAAMPEGDTVVQNGTRHAWRSPFSEPCRIVVVLIVAERIE